MIGSHGALPVWGKTWTQTFSDWWYGEEPPAAGGESAEVKKKRESDMGLVSVKDQGGYTWIVYSNGDIKIFDVPAGKEHLMGQKYRPGDANYAAILAKLRKLDPQVDKILGKSKSKPKSKPKKTYTPAPSPSPSYPPQPYIPPPTPNGKGGKPFPVWTIPLIAVVVLGGLGLVVFRRRKPKKGRKS
jgi:hypothetical protein